MSLKRPFFATNQEYGRYFTNPSYWHPYVGAICVRHDLGNPVTVRAGLPGTHPVFLVNEQYAVKLYTDLFSGEQSYQAEREVYRLIATEPALPAPSLVATGKLFDEQDGWPWPYIVTRVVPGLSITESSVSYTDHLDVAAWLGTIVRRMHSLPLVAGGPLSPEWKPFLQFLAARRAEVVANHARWGSLPAHLVAQIDEYIPDLTTLIDEEGIPALLHCDLNSDHVLGESVAGHWRPTGVIDFGDARVGDRIYELVALHLGLFHCDGAMLKTFLEAYGFDEALRRDFAKRAMCMALLYEFNDCSFIFKHIPAAASVGTLDELAELVWGSAFA
jgi:Ser/Thr protein kinase RdoA (MazF antagonist)